ncbi:hypothetical protein SKAU_G00266630 [Synaphobranchus kaupii]|uniref:Uncharacterized protein n=1 Tax=Synaphobranchus kaupii TaxID=118154 RepID=A0A9Q1IQ72_SYNKA|nr:hypothetical protein SKAU_G00266630 [Synaphobranchus kaupii]
MVLSSGLPAARVVCGSRSLRVPPLRSLQLHWTSTGELRVNKSRRGDFNTTGRGWKNRRRTSLCKQRVFGREVGRKRRDYHGQLSPERSCIRLAHRCSPVRHIPEKERGGKSTPVLLMANSHVRGGGRGKGLSVTSHVPKWWILGKPPDMEDSCNTSRRISSCVSSVGVQSAVEGQVEQPCKHHLRLNAALFCPRTLSDHTILGALPTLPPIRDRSMNPHNSRRSFPALKSLESPQTDVPQAHPSHRHCDRIG